MSTAPHTPHGRFLYLCVRYRNKQLYILEPAVAPPVVPWHIGTGSWHTRWYPSTVPLSGTPLALWPPLASTSTLVPSAFSRTSAFPPVPPYPRTFRASPVRRRRTCPPSSTVLRSVPEGKLLDPFRIPPPPGVQLYRPEMQKTQKQNIHWNTVVHAECAICSAKEPIELNCKIPTYCDA